MVSSRAEGQVGAGAAPASAARRDRKALLLLAATLGITGLSWARFLTLGELAVDHSALPLPFDVLAASLFVLLVCVALRAHVSLVEALGSDSGGVRLVGLSWWALGLALACAPMLPLLSNDIFSVLAYGDLAFRTDTDPFTLSAPGLLASRYFPFVSPSWMSAPCVYGPVQLWFWAPASVLTTNPFFAVGIVKLLALVAVGMTLLLLRRHCARGGAAGTAAFALVALNPVLWIEGAGQAHNDVVAAMLLAGWLLLARHGRVLSASLVLGLAVASKLTVAVPAGMYLVFLATRAGDRRAQLRGSLSAAAAMAGALVLAYLPFWRGLETLLIPFQFLAQRAPSNTLAELVFHGLRQMTARPTALLIVGTAGSVLSALVFVAGAALAWRARELGELVSAAAKLSLLMVTLVGTVFHPWYLLPCLVLAVELRDPTWRRWLLLASSASLLVDGAVLFAWGTLQREIFTALTLLLACALWLHRLRPRLADLYGRL